jgi:hypothetical protein
LFTDSVFLVGISWYFSGIDLPYQYQTKSWLIHVGIKILAVVPFSLQKGGLWTPFGALSPPFEGKRVSCGFFSKKEFPETSKKSSCQIL